MTEKQEATYQYAPTPEPPAIFRPPEPEPEPEEDHDEDAKPEANGGSERPPRGPPAPKPPGGGGGAQAAASKQAASDKSSNNASLKSQQAGHPAAQNSHIMPHLLDAPLHAAGQQDQTPALTIMSETSPPKSIASSIGDVKQRKFISRHSSDAL